MSLLFQTPGPPIPVSEVGADDLSLSRHANLFMIQDELSDFLVQVFVSGLYSSTTTPAEPHVH